MRTERETPADLFSSLKLIVFWLFDFDSKLSSSFISLKNINLVFHVPLKYYKCERGRGRVICFILLPFKLEKNLERAIFTIFLAQ